MFLKAFGKNPSGQHLEKIKQSPNYKKKGFENVSYTPVMADDASYKKMLAKFFNKDPASEPATALPSVKTGLKKSYADTPVITWFGHSSYLIKIKDINILVDPVFSGHASPLPFMIKAFKGTDIFITDDFPAIDFLILTHDHYDHLDYTTLKKFKNKIKAIYCPLGVSSHLLYWNFDKTNITEMDWWQTCELQENLILTAAPARHFSGRGLTRYKTLWCSFILKTASHTLYLGGDSGYDTHFKTIGDTYGPFDLALLEDGQYNTDWPFIHMMPEQTIQAAIDLKAKVLLPVHWGKFSLAFHPWREPVQRALQAATDNTIKVTTPMIGETVIVDEIYPDKTWWEF